MKKFEQTLIELTELNEAYELTSLNDGDALNELLQQITVRLAYLVSQKCEYKKQYEMKVFDLTTNKKMTVARAINFAEVDVPELYLLRQIIDANNRVVDAIRTNISYLKSEKNNMK